MKVVVFTRNSARVIYNPSQLDLKKLYHFTDQVVVDPDLSRVKGYPPHHWKLIDGEVWPLQNLELNERDNDIRDNGSDLVTKHLYTKQHTLWQTFLVDRKLAYVTISLKGKRWLKSLVSYLRISMRTKST